MTGAVEVLASDVRRVLAPNPSPMTLEGTNTWVLGAPGRGPSLVVDPGPDDAGHREWTMAVAAPVGRVWITHRHLDHTAGSAALAADAGCPVFAADPVCRVPQGLPGTAALGAGDEVDLGGVRLVVVATPGHTSDSLCFLLGRPDGTSWLLTGDTVLGRGTTVITHPDGDLGAYLDSLERLRRLVDQADVTRILPGHGPVLDRPAEVLDHYRDHRLERLAQLRDALAAGDADAAAIVRRVYADVDRSVWPAAEQSVRAQLDYLRSTRPG